MTIPALKKDTIRKMIRIGKSPEGKTFAVHIADKDLKPESIKNSHKSEIKNENQFLKVGGRL